MIAAFLTENGITVTFLLWGTPICKAASAPLWLATVTCLAAPGRQEPAIRHQGIERPDSHYACRDARNGPMSQAPAQHRDMNVAQDTDYRQPTSKG